MAIAVVRGFLTSIRADDGDNDQRDGDNDPQRKPTLIEDRRSSDGPDESARSSRLPEESGLAVC